MKTKLLIPLLILSFLHVSGKSSIFNIEDYEYFFFQKPNLLLKNQKMLVYTYSSLKAFNKKKGVLQEVNTYDSLGYCFRTRIYSTTNKKKIYKDKCAIYNQNRKLQKVIVSMPEIYKYDFIYSFNYTSDSSFNVVVAHDYEIKDTIYYVLNSRGSIKTRNELSYKYNTFGYLLTIEKDGGNLVSWKYDLYNNPLQLLDLGCTLFQSCGDSCLYKELYGSRECLGLIQTIREFKDSSGNIVYSEINDFEYKTVFTNKYFYKNKLLDRVEFYEGSEPKLIGLSSYQYLPR